MQSIRKFPLGRSRLLFLGSLLACSPGWTQELEPLTYTNAPVGLDVLIVGGGYSEGGVLPDPSVPMEDGFIKITGLVTGYGHTFGLWGKSSRIGLVLPYAFMDGTAQFEGETVQRKVSGFGDTAARFQINFVGAPALELQDYGKYQQDMVIGFSAVLLAPTGQYDGDNLVNIGANRWMFKPELGISKTVGKWTFELSGSVKFFSDNNNYYGGQVREQKPISASQAHVTYHFNRSTWLSLNTTKYIGGRTTVDGVQKNDELDSSRMGVNFSKGLTPTTALQFYFTTGVSIRYGSDFDSYGIILKHTWR